MPVFLKEEWVFVFKHFIVNRFRPKKYDFEIEFGKMKLIAFVFVHGNNYLG